MKSLDEDYDIALLIMLKASWFSTERLLKRGRLYDTSDSFMDRLDSYVTNMKPEMEEYAQHTNVPSIVLNVNDLLFPHRVKQEIFNAVDRYICQQY